MSSTPVQNSRYPRPLKATRSFQQQFPSYPFHSGPSAQSEPSLGIGEGAFSTRTISPFTGKHHPINDCRSSDGVEGGSVSSPELPMASFSLTEKRSNSLDSLNTSDLPVSVSQKRTKVSHKRSRSLSNYRAVPSDPTAQVHPVVYSRFSVEGLNQEVSSALEGKSLLFEFSHPDGHIAPVNDLAKGGVTTAHITVTTPIRPSPPLPPSPLVYSSDDLSSSVSSLHLNRASPVVIDVHSSSFFPSSPKSMFNHKPPDSAEKCTSIRTKKFCSGNYVPKAPDSSKANIAFNGSVFSPLFPSPHSIEPLSIS